MHGGQLFLHALQQLNKLKTHKIKLLRLRIKQLRHQTPPVMPLATPQMQLLVQHKQPQLVQLILVQLILVQLILVQLILVQVGVVHLAQVVQLIIQVEEQAMVTQVIITILPVVIVEGIPALREVAEEIRQVERTRTLARIQTRTTHRITRQKAHRALLRKVQKVVEM